MYSAVAFDVDGTLYPNAAMYRRSFFFALRHARLLHNYRIVRKELRRIRPIGDFYRVQADRLAEALGIGTPEARELIDRVIYREWEAVLHKVKLYPGAREVLTMIRERGAKLAVVSDFPVRKKMAILGLDGLWDCLISAEETGYLKPNPEPFAAAAECLGVSPEKILFVGNSYEYDVVGAQRAGMHTAHITSGKPNTADFTFSRFCELAEWLDSRLPTSG